MGEIDAVVFDKTGTLTRGELRVVDGQRKTPIIAPRAATAASSSQHPVSLAVNRPRQNS